MVKILELRSLLRAYYQKFQVIVDPILKFAFAFITLRLINNALGFDVRLEKTAVVLLVSLFCALTPTTILVFVAMAFSVLHVFAASPFMALFVLIMFVILYCFLLRFAPQYASAVVAIPVLYTLNIPYLVPILLGLFANPITILPSMCGVIVYYMFDIIKMHTVMDAGVELDDVLPLYTGVFEDMINCKSVLIVSGVFAVVIIVVFMIRKLKMEYASEIAALAGGVVNVFGFLICDLKFDQVDSIGRIIGGTVLSALLAVIVLFFKRVLDYTAVENVQFEDDDYYYYVKAVPKIEIGLKERKVKNITEERTDIDNEDEEDDYEEILDEETGEVIFRPKSGKSAGGQVKRQAGGRGTYFSRRLQEDAERAKEAFRREEREKAESNARRNVVAPAKPENAFEAEKRAMERYANGEEIYMDEDELLRNDNLRQRENAESENSSDLSE